MIKVHAWRSNPAKLDVPYIYEEGDAILLWARKVGKSKAHARGPYLFCHYLGTRHLNTEMVDLVSQKS